MTNATNTATQLPSPAPAPAPSSSSSPPMTTTTNLLSNALSIACEIPIEETNIMSFLDLREFSEKLKDYVFVNLNTNRRAAILSFAYSIGIQSFKNCRLLDLINS